MVFMSTKVETERKKKYHSGGTPNKGIPITPTNPRPLEGWAKSKKIRPRNLETNAFIKNNAENRDAMGYLMNRKIKWFGIEPTPFIDEAREYAEQNNRARLEEAIKKDIENSLNF